MTHWSYLGRPGKKRSHFLKCTLPYATLDQSIRSDLKAAPMKSKGGVILKARVMACMMNVDPEHQMETCPGNQPLPNILPREMQIGAFTMSPKLAPSDFFDLSHTPHAPLFRDIGYVWEALPKLANYLEAHIGGKGCQIFGDVADGAYIKPDTDVYIGPGAVVESGAYIEGPAYIGPRTLVRHGAYIRSNALLCEGSMVGHATEVKNSILLPGAHAPHFNYVGDSILGNRVNLGAGTKLSNLTVVSRKDPLTGRRPSIKIKILDRVHDTGLTKLGAILGDDVQTGCNSVLNPGVLIGPNTLLYASASLPKGYYPANTIIKLRQTFEYAERR